MAKHDLFIRVLFIIFAIPLVLFVIFFPVKFNILIIIFIIILMILSSYELSFCLKNKEIILNLPLFIIQSFSIIIFFILLFNSIISIKVFIFSIISLILLSSFFYIFKNNIIKNALAMFLHIFSLFYIPISLSTILAHYYLIEQAANFLLFFLIIVWSSNISGYIVGLYWLPRNPLNLEVSPNKSKKGFFGAIFFGTLIPFSLTFLFPSFFNFQGISKIIVFLLIFLTNIFSIMGDLFESSLKRFSGVKDSSNYLKGFGGILDTIDSILFSFPFYFSFLLLLFKSNI